MLCPSSYPSRLFMYVHACIHTSAHACLLACVHSLFDMSRCAHLHTVCWCVRERESECVCVCAYVYVLYLLVMMRSTCAILHVPVCLCLCNTVVHIYACVKMNALTRSSHGNM